MFRTLCVLLLLSLSGCMSNEEMIRMGGAGVAGSANGGLAAIGAATSTYGQIQDSRRYYQPYGY